MFTRTHIMLTVIISAVLTGTGLPQGRIMRRGPAPGSVEQTNNVQTFPDTCEIPQQQVFPSELKYYQSFHPADSIFDFWCKVQTLNGSGTFKAEIGENNSYTFLHHEPFSFNGTPQSSRRYLAKVLTEALQLQISGDRGGDRGRGPVITPMSACF